MFKELLFLTVTALVLCGNHPDCGKKGPRTTELIINGEPTKPLEYPWQVMLKYFGHFICGGSIINEEWILTATHCVEGNEPSDFSVVLGEHNMWVHEGTEIEIGINKIITHPNGFWDNDVAILKMNRRIDFNGNERHLGPVCLPYKEGLDDRVGTPCISTGWGVTETGDISDVLRKVTLNIMSVDECKSIWDEWDIYITDGMICASGEYGTGNCYGDSGGPLNCRIYDRWFEYGSHSWGIAGCDQGYPNVDARISEVSDWIWYNIDNNSLNFNNNSTRLFAAT